MKIAGGMITIAGALDARASNRNNVRIRFTLKEPPQDLKKSDQQGFHHHR